VENSTLFNAQAQYDFSLSGGKHLIIAGADLDLTTPDTEGTIYGRNEDNDKISEYGAYLQSTSALSPKFDLTLALRGDYNNIQEDFQLSPRVALVLKPSTDHSFRATYNRAFSSPGNNSNFLDIVAREPDATLPIRIRGRGAANGFTFPHNPAFAAFAGTDLVATSLNPATLGQPQPVGLPLNSVYATVYAGLAAIPTAQLQALLAAQGINLPVATVGALVQLLSPAATTVSGFSRGVLGLLNTTTGTINPVSGVTDIAPLKPTITQSLEAGYKGLINKRILFAVDVYYTKKKNFVGPLLMETPFVLVPTLAADLRGALTTGITNNAQLAGALQQAGLSPAAVSQIVVGLAAARLPSATTPVAIVAPNENSLGAGQAPELLLSYRNFGNVDFIGVDASVQISATNRLSFFGNMSWVSDDFFDNKELDEAGTNLSLALNAPKFKAKGGFSYNIPKGFSFNAAARYSDGFPVRSGPYQGDVADYFLLDVGAGYDLSTWAPGMTFDIMVQNVLDKEHREFIGAPKLGRLGLARLNYTF
jgi:iron complex outermembrane receptor protein